MGKKDKAQDHKNERTMENAEVSMNRVYQKTIIYNTVLSWRVPHYERLECNVMYFQLYESMDIKCALRLIKREESLCICVSGTLPKRTAAEFSILDETNMTNVKAKAEVIAEGVYATQFLNDQFLTPDLSFLTDGILTISFKYASDAYETYKETSLDSEEVITDLDNLCLDLKNMYLEALYSDFLIVVDKYSFRTHRFILMARSPYFDDVIQLNMEAVDYILEGYPPGIVHETLIYMYSGELKEMDMDCMLRVYDLACLWEVEPLLHRCMDYMKTHINKKNYLDVYDFATKKRLNKLGNLVTHFVKKEMPEVNMVDHFRKPQVSATADDGK